jgi:hypothetical protein
VVTKNPVSYSGSCIFSKTIIAIIGPATSPKAQPARYTKIQLSDVTLK